MATAGGLQDIDITYSPLRDLLLQHPGRFDFFQALRLIERLNPAFEPVGYFARPSREIARLRVNNTLNFPPAQIASIEWPENGQAQMLVNFMGLTGPAGVLPYVLTDFILERERNKDRSVRDFFDLFNHRMISLFYRAWEKTRFFVGYERNQGDQFSRHLLALVGLQTGGLQDRQAIKDQSLVFYTGLLALQPRSATALQQLLEDYFKVPVEIDQFVGAWYTLQQKDQCGFRDPPSLSEQLGVAVTVGDAVWDQQCRVRIKLGPLSAKRYLEFLPGGSAYEPLCALTRFFGRGQVEFQAQLILKRAEVPECELGREDTGAPQLSWFSWLRSKPSFSRDPDDTILDLS